MPLGRLIDYLAEKACFPYTRVTFDEQYSAPAPFCAAKDLTRDPQLRITSSHRGNHRKPCRLGISRSRCNCTARSAAIAAGPSPCWCSVSGSLSRHDKLPAGGAREPSPWSHLMVPLLLCNKHSQLDSSRL